MKNTKIVGGLLLPLRLVTSWLFLSAVLRRLFLNPAKHDMESPMWIGHKINTFFPHANGIFKEVLGYLVVHPTEMNWFTYIFTYSELIVGVLLLFGFFSRFTGGFLLSLAIGLMHTAGWLGPTCLDEWQIASLLGTVGGILLIFGSGDYSLDSYLTNKYPKLQHNILWKYGTQLSILTENKNYKKIVITYSIIALLYVMGTNQLLHGGVWGTLHNYSTKPNIEISNIENTTTTLSFDSFRDKGPETYGAFVVEINLYNSTNQLIFTLNDQNFDKVSISNYYLNKVFFNGRALVYPLGGKAQLKFKVPEVLNRTTKRIELVDISGKKFTVNL
ncbi:TQO small subunit DoxD [Flammeovirga kamogawensis]|uniref:DoxX family membrane protein n=1 Tax=Flammeovirga kamogawensis TaxID=373891 RepID=A0ABX8H480_9BACT|nr:TQO small subunit DoxD [Flammeovirga kamogawensis]MBB6460152.1 thiosulfate dehydrogenase [quinone] large subunit [Flammeovirga kamogawensis]QWG09965.1 DoxX family membrane protein [Flammeovirga kamogawensis]TRX65472.1 DoxX family membrane protein [Flammeovirga kamogawensis]